MGGSKLPATRKEKDFDHRSLSQDFDEMENPLEFPSPLQSGATKMIPECLEREDQLMSTTRLTDVDLISEDDENAAHASDPYKRAMQKMMDSKMMPPNSHFRANWDLAQAVLLGYIAIMLPYRIGFSHTTPLWTFWFFFDLCVDIYFIVDLVLNFRTAVVTNEGQLLYSQREVTLHYAKGWFTIDFVSCLPLSYADYFFVQTGDIERSNNKLVRLLRAFRLLKLLRLVRIKRILDRWEEEMYGKRTLRVGKLIFAIIVASHWLCCGWFFAGDAKERLAADGITRIQGWSNEMYPLEIREAVDFSAMYFQAYYWAACATIMVDTTSAAPASSPDTWEEKVWYMIAFAVGTIVISVVIGQVSDMIAHANPGEKHQAELVGMVHGFLHERKVSPILTRQIRSHFSNLYKLRGTMMNLDTDLIAKMPYGLRVELATEIGLLDNPKTSRSGIFSGVSFFAGLDDQDLIMIGCRLQHVKIQMHATKHKSKQARLEAVDADINHTFIMRQGERDDRMFIILEGAVRMARASSPGGGEEGVGELESLGKLQENDHFGELAVLVQEAVGLPFRRLRSAYSISSTCILCALSFQDVHELRAWSPRIDAAVGAAVATVTANRPSLLSKTSNGAAAGRDQVADRLARLESKMDSLTELIRGKA